jgi:DNA-damage-inducible protein J
MKQPRYNAETEAAMQEARDIPSGKVKAKSYASARELADELMAEPDAEC